MTSFLLISLPSNWTMTHFLGLCYFWFGKSSSPHKSTLFFLPPAYLHPPLFATFLWGIRGDVCCLLPDPTRAWHAWYRSLSSIHKTSLCLRWGFLKSLLPHCLPRRQSSALNQPAFCWNTTSQSHLSHCVKQSSIHPPDKTHSCTPPSPNPCSVKFVSPNSTPTYPCRSTPHYTPETPPPGRVFIYFLWVKGLVEALHLHGHSEQRLLCSDCNHHKQIQ